MVREICYERRLHLQTSQYSLNIYALEWGYVKVNGCWFGTSMLCIFVVVVVFFSCCVSMWSKSDFSSIFLCFMLHEYSNAVDNLMENLEKYCSASRASGRLNMPCMIKIYGYIRGFSNEEAICCRNGKGDLVENPSMFDDIKAIVLLVVKLQFSSDYFNCCFTRPCKCK